MKHICSINRFLPIVITLPVLCLPVEASVIKISFIGDSMTMPRSKPKDYPARLQEMMGDGYEIINSAVNGRTVIAHGKYPYLPEKAFKEIFTHKPHIITITLGTNDTKPGHWKDSADFEPDYRMLVDSLLTIRTTHPDDGSEMTPRIILCYPPKVAVDCWKCTNGRLFIRDPIIKNIIIPIINRIAEDKNLHVIDTYTPFIGKEKEMYRDGLHFNEEGNQYMAELLQPILSKVGFEPVTGCMDTTSVDYDPKATVHDEYYCGNKKFVGCMMEGYKEYNPDANVQDSTMCLTGIRRIPRHNVWLRSPLIQGPGIVTLSLRENTSWKLFDIRGGPLKVHQSRNGEALVLQTGTLQSGIYLLTLENSDGALVRKLTVY